MAPNAESLTGPWRAVVRVYLWLGDNMRQDQIGRHRLEELNSILLNSPIWNFGNVLFIRSEVVEHDWVTTTNREWPGAGSHEGRHSVSRKESCRTSSSTVSAVSEEFEKLVYGVAHSPEMRFKRTLLIINKTFFLTTFFVYDNREARANGKT